MATQYNPQTGEWEDDGQYGASADEFYGGAPPALTPNTAPSVNFQGQSYPATSQSGVYGQAPQASGYGGPQDFTSIVTWWKSQHPAQAPDIPGLITFLNSKGINASNATHNGMQSDDKLLYNGQIYDLGSSLGSPGGSWFNDVAPMGGGGGDYAIDPSFLAPYTQQFQSPGDAALPQFQGPGAFRLPSAEDMLKDPGYQWEEGRIRDSIENSASAAGTLNSSGTLDRIMGGVSNFARTGYNNLVNRQYGVWNSDWSHALDAYDKQFGRANNIYNRAVGEYDMGKRLFFENQDRPADKLFRGADLGFRAANA